MPESSDKLKHKKYINSNKSVNDSDDGNGRSSIGSERLIISG